jgi:hypothetical protein
MTNNQTTINPLIRKILVFAVFIGSYILSWLLFLFIPTGNFDWITSIFSMLIAVGVARTFWLKADTIPKTLIGTTAYGAIILGSIGFAAGFFGPMIFAPDANQGPLLGIFYTGPIGFMLGAICGLFYGLKRA